MKINCNSFFDGEFDYLNLNDLYLKNKDKILNSKDPSQIQSVLNSLGRNTYGGYGEDRKDIWRGTYMDVNKNYIHLGIDINVPFNTPIHCPFDAQIINWVIDADTNIGWGGRLMLTQENKPFLILGHIDPPSMPPSIYRREATYVKRGDIIGAVGNWPTNGNTFHHLHVQTLNKLAYDFDGYGSESDLTNSPNPFEIDFL